MKSGGLSAIMIALLFLCGTAYAERNIWYVHPDSALNTIQAGLDSCVDNDIVLVGPGTYYENIVWPNTQGIHLISELGPQITVIDGGSTERVITITSVVDTMTIIMGFTIQNGQPLEPGGGLYCTGSSPTISGNIISGNHSGFDPGGGIFCEGNSTAIIRNNVIVDNVAGFGGGGGIHCLGSSPIIAGNTITDNSGVGGGGITCNSSSPIITNNTITHNLAAFFSVGTSGGGILCINNSAPTIRHNTITMNTATAWGGGGGLHCNASSPIIDSCTISNNIRGGIGTRNGAIPIISHCNITDNTNEAVRNWDSLVTVVAEYNWWGDATGPYHPTANPGGLGDTVSDYVDFDPWLTDSVQWVGIQEKPITKPIDERVNVRATVFGGSLQLPEGKKCKVFDITGRVVEPSKIQPGIYFIEVDGVVTRKVVKVR
jgi:hypothetical protein